MCAYHQQSPESPFTCERLVTIATPRGRVTLAGLRLIETAAGLRSERVLREEDEWAALLLSRFGIAGVRFV